MFIPRMEPFFATPLPERLELHPCSTTHGIQKHASSNIAPANDFQNVDDRNVTDQEILLETHAIHDDDCATL
jgi:hypothetical protein